MNGLTEEQKAMAWDALMETPSFVGIAYLDEDFVYQYVNGQFLKILDVTPAQIIGQRMQDSTAPGMIRLEEANANLMKQGLQDFYTMEKSFEFGDGKKKDVVLTKCRVPISKKGSFQFFIVQIIEGEEVPKISDMEVPTQYDIEYQTAPRLSSNSVLDFFKEYGATLALISAVATGAVAAVLKTLKVIP